METTKRPWLRDCEPCQGSGRARDNSNARCNFCGGKGKEFPERSGKVIQGQGWKQSDAELTLVLNSLQPETQGEQIMGNIVQDAVDWISFNDEPTWTDREDISRQLTVVLVADLFRVTPEQVADLVLVTRRLSLRRSAELEAR